RGEHAAQISTPYWKCPVFYDDDDDEYNIQYKKYFENSSNAITPNLPTKEPDNSLSMRDEHLETIPKMESDEVIKSSVEDLIPILRESEASTEEPDNSLSMGDEHLDTIPATESDEVIKSSVEDLVPIPSESEGILDTMCDVHLVNNPTPLEAKDHFEIVINSNDDYSSSNDDSLYNVNIEYVEASPHDSELIQALKDNPTPSSELLTKSSSTSLKSFLEETKTFDNSLPEFENFCFDLEEISSGSTTTHSDISLPHHEAFYFYDDHIKEINSGSTTTHSDISLLEYDSLIFDLSNDQFPPTDMSDFTHKEFTDELAHIISPPEYDCFYFR
nr:hypothetical protein [Tanacetum cinerariifolium]